MRSPRCPPAQIRPTRLQVQHGTVSGVGSQPDEQFQNSEVTLLACAVQGCQALLPGSPCRPPAQIRPTPPQRLWPGIRHRTPKGSGVIWRSLDCSHVANVTHRRVIPMYQGLRSPSTTCWPACGLHARPSRLSLLVLHPFVRESNAHATRLHLERLQAPRCPPGAPTGAPTRPRAGCPGSTRSGSSPACARLRGRAKPRREVCKVATHRRELRVQR